MLDVSRYGIISLLLVLTLIVFLAFNPDSYDQALTGSEDIVIREDKPGSEAFREIEVAVVAGSMASDDAVANTTLALTLLKRAYMTCASVTEAGEPQTIIMEASHVSDEEVKLLKSYLAGGGSVIFAELPEMTAPVMDLLQITSKPEQQYVWGFEVYEGVLLGGMLRADRVLYHCEGVKLSGRCKVFANGFNVGVEREMTPLIWRTFYEGGVIYALNAPFLRDPAGMGMLAGVLAMAQRDFLYPIVGTRSLALTNFPYFTDDAEISGRTPFVFTRDVVWPGLLSIARNTGLTLTCYASGGVGTKREAYDTWNFVIHEQLKIRGELGSAAEDSEQLALDLAFLKEREPSYTLRSVKASGGLELPLNDATSVMLDGWGGAMRWLNDQAVSLPLISDGIGGDFSYFRMVSAVSLMGYAAHQVDMAPVYRGDVSWNDYSYELAGYLTRTMAELGFLRAVPVAIAAEEVKNYLNAAVTIRRSEDAIFASLENNAREMNFILRTSRDIDFSGCENCAVAALEPGVYYVKSPGPEFEIRFKRDAEAMP